MRIRVAVGIILRGDTVLIALRKVSQHQGGLWEFPGGKCEQDEAPHTALVRELQEECGIMATTCTFFKLISHDYVDKRVELHFYKVTAFGGEPRGKEGQQVMWVAFDDLSDYAFPEANQSVVLELMSCS
ncbi:8-oxo-dGTP diphosphatase MutT [Marinomonas sp. IMCC 4694]|uniref:8-oxo-dGTP diphosphatase MutT n=1 Tax=Marinomonas sp. IMCC 4694 TaxID=2605432 RepID=UPI0011E622E7|nr:8-oxo-dGTP diphosphatase MutT [Marinomonas sp. IMCC 4694]TYL49422.1 8-oxo-dGTP diphosphatase MutT [Marinomonas sp. IMCC 4694]